MLILPLRVSVFSFKVCAACRGRRVLIRGGRILDGTGAAVFRVRDRGVIRPGAYADLVIFDLAAIRDSATYEAPHQLAEGMHHVFINGQAALAEGKLTDLRAGRVLTRVRP